MKLGARPCSCCDTDIPSAQGPPGTAGCAVPTVHICCSLPVSPWQRYAMGFVEWHKCPAEGALSPAEDGSEMFPLLSCGWGTREEGDALPLLCDGTREPSGSSVGHGGACTGTTLGTPLSSGSVGAAKASLCHIKAGQLGPGRERCQLPLPAFLAFQECPSLTEATFQSL